MKHFLLALIATVLISTSAQAAHKAARYAYVAPPQAPVIEPLRQIPIVGTVVYGGLDYAGAIIFSPLEIIYGPPPRR